MKYLTIVFLITSGIMLGQWIAQPLLTVPGQTYYPSVVDVNKDNYPDIIAASNPEGIWLWAGDTSFLPRWSPLDTIEMPGLRFYSTGIGDFNRDGNADMVATSYPGVYTWTGDGAPNPRWTLQSQPDQSGFYIGSQAKDLNHDNICDIVASSTGGSRKGISVWLSDGNTNPGWIRQPAPGPDTTYDYHTVTVADVNKDGHLDIVAGHQNDRLGIKVWTGNGGQGGQVIFTPQASPTTSGQYLTVAVGDVNNDGNPDIVGAQQQVNIGVWLGDGNINPHWTPANGPPASGDYWGVALGDLNGDRNLDIVASNVGSREIQAWFGNGGQGGNLVWTPAPAFSPSAGYEGVVITDVNHDNKPDVIAGNWSARGIQVWINNITTIEENRSSEPAAFTFDCRPNPFSQKIDLILRMAEENTLTIKVFDLTGRLIKVIVNKRILPGQYQFFWDGTDSEGRSVTSGTYFVRIKTRTLSLTKPVVYLGQ